MCPSLRIKEIKVSLKISSSLHLEKKSFEKRKGKRKALKKGRNWQLSFKREGATFAVL